MKIVYRAANPQEAHIVAGLLQAEGIDAQASGSFLQGGIGELPASDFAVVRVAPEDATRARVIVEGYDDNATPSEWDPGDESGEPTPAGGAPGWRLLLLCLAAVAFAALTVVSWS